ncbi:hypothetical protein [Corynebacterium tuberculostearicum]|uniref:hypothetical protein n=1 Tax=Corynebacterium tuberculostearicum TaxID=38304 RepID=UPI0020273402|nr:hypothetical protein [Corynebacterium tuberculostearicum]MCG7455647.1 hypothetical protein [Corynebacterium tuberculostearicum]
MLAELSPEQEEQVTQGAKEFPFDAVLDVLNSKHSYEDKGSRILAISGTWMNAASGSQWAGLTPGKWTRRGLAMLL